MTTTIECLKQPKIEKMLTCDNFIVEMHKKKSPITLQPEEKEIVRSFVNRKRLQIYRGWYDH